MKNIPVLTVLLLFFVSFLNAQNKFINFLECEKYNQERAILLFYKPDCPYCLHLRNDIESNLQFQEVLQSKYSITLVDVTALEGQNLALKYGVKSVPLIICYDSNNSEVKRIKGYNSLSKIASYLDLKSSIVSTSKNGLNICGDGILDSDEECDDGNVINGDGCESNCTITQTFPICGNGIVESGETCDDGNVINGDGCESNCTITQTFPICGNGIIESGETCDDGNVINGDGCESNCTITQTFPICGNGIVESGETCDDGNVINGDGCESNCTITQTPPLCGNGIIESGETCDDGNVINGDGCESNCTISILSYDNFNESSKKFSLFPMPFLNNFSIEFQSNNETDFTTSIYNERGQLIKHQSQINTINGNLIIHVSELDQLKSGIYFLKIENSNQSFNVIRKIVKI